MAQDKIKMNGVEIWQPDRDLSYGWETTYSQDTTRVVNGLLHLTALFTVEQLSYSASNIPVREVAKILQIIMSGEPFTLHYFSPRHGGWRDGSFYVGQGQSVLGTLKAEEEVYTSLSFNMTGVNPV